METFATEEVWRSINADDDDRWIARLNASNADGFRGEFYVSSDQVIRICKYALPVVHERLVYLPF